MENMSKYLINSNSLQMELNLSDISNTLSNTGLIDKAVIDAAKVMNNAIIQQAILKSKPIVTKLDYLRLYKLIKEKQYTTAKYALFASQLDEYFFKQGMNPYNIYKVHVQGYFTNKDGKNLFHVELFFYDKEDNTIPFTAIYAEVNIGMNYNDANTTITILDKQEYNIGHYYVDSFNIFKGLRNS